MLVLGAMICGGRGECNSRPVKRNSVEIAIAACMIFVLCS